MVAMRERPEPEQRTAKARILMVIGALPNAKMWADIAAGRAPGRDYDALRKALDADAVYPNDLQTSLLGRLLLRVLGRQVALALAAFRLRRNYDTIYCDSEGIGLPLAMLLKLALTRPGHPRLIVL